MILSEILISLRNTVISQMLIHAVKYQQALHQVACPCHAPMINCTAMSHCSGGFVVFYDFVSGLDMGSQSVRLVVGLYNNIAQYGEPTVLPTVYCDSSNTNFYGHNMAIIGAKQPVPR